MDTLTSLLGVGLFGTIGGVLFYSLMLQVTSFSSLSDLAKNPRFIAGWICFVIAFLIAIQSLCVLFRSGAVFSCPPHHLLCFVHSGQIDIQALIWHGFTPCNFEKFVIY